MKNHKNQISLVPLSIALAVASLALIPVLPGSEAADPKPFEVRTTAYTHTERDHLQYGKKTAAGTTLVSGKVNSAAADWSFLPLGTTFKIRGDATIYKVEDYGGALVGTRTVDIYRPCMKTMNQWGVRFVKIEILELGCRLKSIELLRGRTHASHCRRMLKRLLSQS